jgi:hypothetical protein
LVIAIVVLMLVAPAMKGEVAAAWAQGILTALGIGLAMYSANQQVQSARTHAEELRQIEMKQRRQGVLAIAEAAFDHIEALDSAASFHSLGAFFEGPRHGQFTHATAALRAVPLHELQSYNMVAGILDLLDVLVRIEPTCVRIEEEHLGGATPEELYFAIHADDLGRALHAMNYIRGGVLGWSSAEIAQRNGGDREDF